MVARTKGSERRKLRNDTLFANKDGTSSSYGFCPTIRPTREEFERPFSEYMGEVFRAHPDCGCVKVIPPNGWKPRKNPYDFSHVHLESPIKQHVFGKGGAYVCILEEQRSMNGVAFENMAKSGQRSPPTRKYAEDDLMERSFWSSITINPPIYGADTHISMFDEEVPWGWNLRDLKCLFEEYDVPEIPGVTSPMAYFGMWKAFFAWHKEDLDLMSINYLHCGAPKVWYCVPPSESKKFDDMAKQLFPEAARACPDFLRHKDIMISPSLLKSYNIRYVQALQHPGEFIVLNAAAYHAGFNLGFNCAEAVNFALEDWLEIGKTCSQCECGVLADGVSLDMSIFFPGLYDTTSEDVSSLDDDGESITDGSNCISEASSSEERSEGTSTSKQSDEQMQDEEDTASESEILSETSPMQEGSVRKRRGRPPGSKNKVRKLAIPGNKPVMRCSKRPSLGMRCWETTPKIELPREATHVTWGPVAEEKPIALVTRQRSAKEKRSFSLVHRLDRKASRPDSAWFGVLERDSEGLYVPKSDCMLVQFGSSTSPRLVNVRTEWTCPETRRRGAWKLLSKPERILM